MLAFQFLNLIVGLVFIYFVFSQVANALFEIFAQLFGLRAKTLKKWLVETFTVQTAGQDPENLILQHGFFQSLCSRDNRIPSYLDKGDFARVFVDSICKKSGRLADNLKSIEASIIESEILPDDIKRMLRIYVEEARAKAMNKAGDEMIHFRQSIEGWFDTAMDRLSGSYRRRARFWTGWFAVILVFALNVDTLALTKFLYGNPAAVATLNEQAALALEGNNQMIVQINSIKAQDSVQTVAQLESTVKAQTAVLKNALGQLDQTLPLGWKTMDIGIILSQLMMVNKLLGLLLSAIAVSMGSPFWFQILNRLASLRSAGVKPGGEEKQ